MDRPSAGPSGQGSDAAPPAARAVSATAALPEPPAARGRLRGRRLGRGVRGRPVLLLAQRVEQVVGTGRLLGRLAGGLRRAGVEDRLRRRRAVRQDREGQAGGEEQGRQDRGGPRQGVGLAAAGHEPADAATAATAAEPESALGALEQHDADQREHDDEVDDDQDGLHRCSGIFFSAARRQRAPEDERTRAGARDRPRTAPTHGRAAGASGDASGGPAGIRRRHTPPVARRQPDARGRLSAPTLAFVGAPCSLPGQGGRPNAPPGPGGKPCPCHAVRRSPPPSPHPS